MASRKDRLPVNKKSRIAENAAAVDTERRGNIQKDATRTGLEMEATLPATPRHTMFPLWLLPSGSDQVHG